MKLCYTMLYRCCTFDMWLVFLAKAACEVKYNEKEYSGRYRYRYYEFPRVHNGGCWLMLNLTRHGFAGQAIGALAMIMVLVQLR